MYLCSAFGKKKAEILEYFSLALWIESRSCGINQRRKKGKKRAKFLFSSVG